MTTLVPDPTTLAALHRAQACLATSAAIRAFCAAQALLEAASPEEIAEAEVAEHLADALQTVLDLDPRPDPDGTSGQLLGALVRYLEGWAG